MPQDQNGNWPPRRALASGVVKGTKGSKIAQSKCDFCSSPDVRWSYPARDFTILPLMVASGGGWAACQTCHDLIETQDWKALAGRSADTHPMVKDGLMPREVAIEFTKTIHFAFRLARTGPAEPTKGD
jgi:hypothetical protein